MYKPLIYLLCLLQHILCIMSQGPEEIWEGMSDIEKMNRLNDLQRRIYENLQNQGEDRTFGKSSSGYGAPSSGYGAPSSGYGAPSSSYGAPSSSFEAPSSGIGAPSSGIGAPSSGYGAPSSGYGAPAVPSYNKPSYGGGGGGKGLPLPSPFEFKAGVLRSKGRIASGILHTKAGILRAGANILAKKAEVLDRFAESIPSMNAGLINTMKGFSKGGGGGYGAPSNTYGAPPPSYSAPKPSYGGQKPSYGASPSSDYGVPQGPVISGGFNQQAQVSANNNNFNGAGFNSNNNNNNFANSQGGNSYNGGASGNSFNNQPSGNSFNNQPSGNSFNSQQSGNNFNGVQSGNSFNGVQSGNSFNSVQSGNSFNTGQPVQNSFQPSNVDTYGNPQGGLISSNAVGNTADIPIGTSLSFGNSGNNGFSSSGFSTGNSGTGSSLTGNSFTGSTGFNNGVSALNTYSTGDFDGFSNSGVNNEFSPLIESTLEQSGGVIRSTRTGPTTKEKLLLESRELGGDMCGAQARSLNSLLKDIFMGNEVIPDVIDDPPTYPLDLTYKTIRTFPGMRLTADMTRFKPMLKWPAQPDSLYTVVISNLDINSRKNRTLAEFWHWFVANIPGDSVDDGEVVFDLLFPLVLPEGDGDHRYGYFVFEQPRQLDYRDEGGPTDACSPQMSNGRGPFKSTKNFMKKYNLKLVAGTFIILDTSEASMEIACEWQKCIGNTINLVSPLQCNKK